MTKIVKKTAGQVVAKKSDAFLDKVRAAKVVKPLDRSAVPKKTPRLVFAFDATASREPAWDEARQITDRLFCSLPGGLDIALAVHGGNTVHTFTPFSSDARSFRDQAAGISCIAGMTRLCTILRRTIDAGGVKVLLYIGDTYEEDSAEAFALADRCKLHGIRVLILADRADAHALEVFHGIAARTDGAVLDFRAVPLKDMGDVLEAVAALAAGGRKLLEGKGTKGAQLLLSHLPK